MMKKHYGWVAAGVAVVAAYVWRDKIKSALMMDSK